MPQIITLPVMAGAVRNSDFFDLPSTGGTVRRNPLLSWLTRPVARFSGLDLLRRCYESLPPTDSAGEFYEQVLRGLGVSWQVNAADVAQIPVSGPVVIIANHPFGAVEGMILGAVLLRLRPDFKFMGNYLLARIPEIKETIIPVDPFGGRHAERRNLAPLRQCLKLLAAGGALGIFPAGEVAHLQFGRQCGVTDPPWNPNVAALIKRSGVPVLPVYFYGRNSAFFQAIGMLHPRFRTLMLAREATNKQQGCIGMRIGTLIPPERLQRFEDTQELGDYLRFRTFLLKHRHDPESVTCKTVTAPVKGWPKFSFNPAPKPIAAAAESALLQEEIELLPAANLILETAEMSVYLAAAAEIPYAMHEIGRLREITFRAVGEGTGHSIDLDRFDRHYQHLFIWNRAAGEIVGAYRIGKVDRILRQHGMNGLYTHTLFRYQRGFLQHLGPALELGRSFIRAEYQRSFSPLLLLWRGIGEVINREPGYRFLLGPVSISNRYQNISRQLLAAFLRLNHRELANAKASARPRCPLRIRNTPDIRPAADAALLTSLDEASAIIAELEPDRKGIPVLLRQYLKLGGVIMGLNVDRKFGNALDGLVLVDLARTEPRLLDKYLGKNGAAAFCNLHQPGSSR